jgi:TPR repeat protein
MGELHFLHATPTQPWRVEALAAMNPAELGEAFRGEEAADWLEAAAACGLVEAQLKLGRMLLTGEGMPADRRAAFACFLSAAGGGNAEARNLLGRCFENGWGTAIDRDAARNCYRLAAEAGDFRGAHNYACVLASDGCIAGALRWFDRATMAAPGPVRHQMLRFLAHHPRCAIRAFAMRALESCPVAEAGQSA